jgi:hypothetical protein
VVILRCLAKVKQPKGSCLCRWTRPRTCPPGTALESTAASRASAPRPGTPGRACPETTRECLALKTSNGGHGVQAVWMNQAVVRIIVILGPCSQRMMQSCRAAVPSNHMPSLHWLQGAQASASGGPGCGRRRRPSWRASWQLRAAAPVPGARRRGGRRPAPGGGVPAGRGRAAGGVWPAAARVQAVSAGGCCSIGHCCSRLHSLLCNLVSYRC